MALRFIDGFDHYATADILKKWTSVNNGLINATSGRRGGGAFSAVNATVVATKTLDAQPTWIVGFAFSSSVIAGALTLVKFLDAGTSQCDLRTNSDGTLSLTRNGTAVTGGTSTLTISANTMYYIEVKVSVADSIAANSCKVRVNGVDVITVATGQDLKNTANASANQISIGYQGSGAAIVYDDLYVCDGTGSTNNDFLGDVRIDTLFPTGDGNYSQFTPSTGTNHSALVDETAPNTTDYNDGLTVGDRDSYAMSNLAALTSQTVYGVQVNAACLKDDAGTKSAAAFIRSSSTNGDGASTALGTTQSYISQVFELDPNGSIAWTETSVNAMEAGVKVTA